MRILVIEPETDPDASGLGSIKWTLKAEGWHVDDTELGEDGVELAKVYDYDAIVVCSGLHDLSIKAVARNIRVAGIKAPIIACSSYGAIEEKLGAFNAGADDYMVRPYHPDELVARLSALVRRSKGHVQSVITTGNMSVNLATKTMTIAGVDIHLTSKEYAVIEIMSLRKGMTITKGVLMDHLYGGMDEPSGRTVDVFICKIREKIMLAGGGSNKIETVWGRGYILRDPPKPIDMSSEVASLTDEPPTGYVSARTFMDRRNEAKASGKVKRVVPVA